MSLFLPKSNQISENRQTCWQINMSWFMCTQAPYRRAKENRFAVSFLQYVDNEQTARWNASLPPSGAKREQACRAIFASEMQRSRRRKWQKMGILVWNTDYSPQIWTSNSCFPPLTFGVAPGTARWLWQCTEANEKPAVLRDKVWLILEQTGQGRECRLRGYERFPVRALTCCPWTRMVPVLHRHVARDSIVPTQMFDFCLLMTPTL